MQIGTSILVPTHGKAHFGWQIGLAQPNTLVVSVPKRYFVHLQFATVNTVSSSLDLGERGHKEYAQHERKCSWDVAH